MVYSLLCANAARRTTTAVWRSIAQKHEYKISNSTTGTDSIISIKVQIVSETSSTTSQGEDTNEIYKLSATQLHKRRK